MTHHLRSLLLLGGWSLFGFGLFVLLFWAGAAASVSILFYRGLVLASISALATGLFVALIGRPSTGEAASLPVAAAAVAFSLNVCFLVLLPVTIDRSVTVYLLSTIERQEPSSVDAQTLEHAFVAGYVTDMHAIDRRLDEQRKSGNLAVSRNGTVRLTAQGKRFMAFSRFVSRLFGTDRRFVDAPAESPGQRRARGGQG